LNSTTRIDLVGVLFVLWGALSALIGASMLALGIGAATLVEPESRSGGGQIAAAFFAASFITLAVLAIIWGVVHIMVGRPIQRRSHWARLAALMLGSVDLILLPYGTALGTFTLYTLLRDDARAAFGTKTADH
jgi:hypothetical protein